MPFPFLAAAAVGSALVGALSSNSAADKAAKASQNATDANTALQREILATQQGNTAVARQTGDAALGALSSRFGLNPQGASGGATTGQGAGPDWNAYLQNNPDILQEGQRVVASGEFPSLEAYAQNHYEKAGQSEGRQLPTAQSSTPAAQAPPSASAGPDWNAYLAQNKDIADAYNAFAASPQFDGRTAEQYAQEHYQGAGIAEGRAAPPQMAARGGIDSQGSYTGTRTTVGPAPAYHAPTYRETAVAPLDVSLGSYQQSPDFNFQQEQGNRQILATASATGGLESGAALKAIQEFGQNLALGDYDQWRSYATGQYNTDRGYTANRDDAANSFNSAQANNAFSSAQGNYQFGTTLGQNMFNSDRDYASNRYDTNTNALLSLAGYGQNATGQSNNALAANASNLSNAYFSNASNQGNAALASAGQFNNALSNGTASLAYYYGGNA